MKLHHSTRFHLSLVLCVGLWCGYAPTGFAAEPQYSIVGSFDAPIFTSAETAPGVFVLVDDKFFAFRLVPNPAVAAGFDRLNGEPTGSLVRFFPDGTVDPTFVLDKRLFGYSVTAVTPAPGGKFLVACATSDRAWDPSNRVFRLNGDGSIDPSFDAGLGATPDSNGRNVILALVIDGDGKTLVGGQFGDFSNSGRGGLIRLNGDGTTDSSFAPVRFLNSAISLVSKGVTTASGIALQTDGKIVVAGAFSEVNGEPRLGVARLNANGTLDDSFVPSGYNPANSSSPSASKQPVNCVAIQPGDGKIILGGIFNPVGAVPQVPSTQVLVRLNGDGSVDASFNAGRTHQETCLSLTLLQDGRPLAAATRRLIRYQTDGSLDTAFNDKFPVIQSGRRIQTFGVQKDGQVVFGGTFQSIFESARKYSGLARVAPDGVLDPSFGPDELQWESFPSQLARRQDGKIVAGGFFEKVNNISRAKIAVLNSDGSLADQSYPHDFFFAQFLLQPDDKLLLFGYPYQGPEFSCVRFKADGTNDDTFAPDPAIHEFDAVLLEPDGGYVLSPGRSPNAIAGGVILSSIHSDGLADESFDLYFDAANLLEREGGTQRIIRITSGDNRALAVFPDGKILYKYFDGEYRIVLLEANGALASSFQMGTASPQAAVVRFPHVYDPLTGRTYQPHLGSLEPTSSGPTVAILEPNGRILLAGQFVSYNGAPAGGIVRLNADGSLHSTLGAGAAFTTTAITTGREPSITAVERDFHNRYLVAGDFESFLGMPAPGIARLNADGSLDSTFEPPVADRTSGAAFTYKSLFLREGNGRFLLVGNHAATVGDNTATSIFRLAIPVRATSLLEAPQGALRIMFTGVPGESYTIQSSTSPAAETFLGGSAPLEADADGIFLYQDATAFSSLRRFYRAVAIP